MKNLSLLFISIAFACGILAASAGFFSYIPYLFTVSFLAVIFLSLIFSINKDSLFLAFLFGFIFFLGAISYGLFNRIDENHIKDFTGYEQKKVFIQGEISSDVEESVRRKKRSLVIESEALKLDGLWVPVWGKVLVTIPLAGEGLYQYGDICIFEGFLRRPFYYKRISKFNYARYLGRKRIFSVLNVKEGFFAKKIGENKSLQPRAMRNVYLARSRLEARIKKFFSQPYSSVLSAVLLGKRQDIPHPLNNAFAKTGTMHILAISGLNVGMIYFVLKIILKIAKIGRNPSLFFTILFLTGYALLAGGSPSILRATIMFSTMAFGDILKRKISIYNLIGLSAMILLVIDPNQIFDVSFIFSYVAVLSMIAITPGIYAVFFFRKMPQKVDTPWKRIKFYLAESISLSVAVWLGLSPILAYYFGLVSIVVIIANLVVVPLLFMIMSAGVLFASLGFISGFLAMIFSQSATFFLYLLIKSVKFLEGLPLGYFNVNPPSVGFLFLYYVLLLLTLNAQKIKKLTFLLLT